MTEQVIVIHPLLKTSPKTEQSLITAQDKLDEAVGLARAIELNIAYKEVINLSRVVPATLIGGGVIDRLSDIIKNNDIGLVYINHPLTPVQQRNLEKRLHTKVIDRTGIILEIFGARATTKEGKLQVELAALSFQKSRLVRTWTHLERQRGGLGATGGPGETQIEIDRRLIGDRIVKLKRELEQVKKNRRLQRASRQKTPFPIIALIGYTNAGKSTLFNTLTGADVFAENLLFATLDPTMRSCTLPSRKKVILSDTVGFISDLPTHLIASFRATLEEVQNASVILYVRDLTHKDASEERLSVSSILKELDIDIDSDERIFEVLNKIDKLSETEQENIKNTTKDNDRIIPISATTGFGLEGLITTIDDFISQHEKQVKISLDITQDSEALSWLYEHGSMLKRTDKDFHSSIKIKLSKKDIHHFKKKYNHIDLKMII